MQNEEKKLILPGNPRYQPKELVDIFGYDNLYQQRIRVEIATLQTLGEIGVIPQNTIAELNPNLVQELLKIRTTQIDQIERQITRHDIRALVRKMQEIMGGKLAQWVHIPLTSYDVVDTARILQFRAAYQQVLKPSIMKVVLLLAESVEKFADQIQIGRTHGQHALPITVGFWLATILNRIVHNWQKMDEAGHNFVGRIAGAVGAHNAQFGLGINQLALDKTGKNFEELVLAKLNLKPAKIATQILPPEILSSFLFYTCLMSASLAQLARDCRQLMRSEIGEVTEFFEKDQVDSSTMAHKRNPIRFENIEGMWLKTKNEFGKVLDVLISEHQRDLVNSSVFRDFSIIVVNLQEQLNVLLREKNGNPFISRITVHQENCLKNFQASAHLVLAEPLYIALNMAGMTGDAHELVNRQLVPVAQQKKIPLIEVLKERAQHEVDLQKVVDNIPEQIKQLLYHPENYIGDAKEKAIEVAKYAKKQVEMLSNNESLNLDTNNNILKSQTGVEHAASLPITRQGQGPLSYPHNNLNQNKPMYNKDNLIMEGKTKKVWGMATDFRLAIMEYKSTITAHDDPRLTKEFATKAEYSNITTCRVFELLREAGIGVAYKEQISKTEFLAEKCQMIPLEVVVRRYAVGSYLKRHPELIKSEGEAPHRFHQLFTEFFLKTTGGKLASQDGRILLEGLDPLKGEEDPLIVNPDEETWRLYHAKKPAWDEQVNLNKNVASREVVPEPKMMQEMEKILRKVFLVLEGAWANLGYRLIDMKIEYGINADGKLLVADVIDNDSWRLRSPDWVELSKETFRQSEELSEVERKYGIVTELAQQFKIPQQALVLWRGSEKDEFPEVQNSAGFEIERVTFSGHKSPQACLNRLEEILAKYPDGGVILTKVGMSNGLGAILAARTSWPVVAIPATIKNFPEDVWSSLRMPSNVPLSVIASETNAVDFALNILAQKNLVVYALRQQRIEGLDV